MTKEEFNKIRLTLEMQLEAEDGFIFDYVSEDKKIGVEIFVPKDKSKTKCKKTYVDLQTGEVFKSKKKFLEYYNAKYGTNERTGESD